MKPSARVKSSIEARATYDKVIEIFFYFRPVEELDEVVHPKFLGYGTAAHEFFKDREALRNMAVMQAEQLRDTQFTLTRKPVIEKFLTNDSTFLILEDFELHMQDNDHILQLRLSTILEKDTDKWVITHFHGSTPDKDIDEEEAFPMEGLRKKNAELEAKIKERTRELEIEAALERVRSRSMAMHKSSEIGDVAFELYQQLKSLGGDLWGTGFAFCKPDSDADEFWFANQDGIMPHLKIPNNVDEAHKLLYNGWKNNLELLSVHKSGKELKDHYKYMLSVPDVAPIFQGMLDSGLKFPEAQTWYAGYFKFGYLLVITIKPYEHADNFKRFAKVFEQAYTRFLDLQKAEQQAREAEMETALEKVRTASMAMQKGEELAKVISVVFAQLKALGIDSEGCTLNLYDKEEGMDIWMSGFGEDVHPRSFHISYFDHPYYRMQLNDWKNGEKYKVLAFEGDLKKSYDEQTFSNKDFFELPEDIRKEFLAKERKLSSAAYMKYGMLEMIGDEALSDSQGDILCRFAKVFEQAYTRFLDIQQAESQAREAQIETALERVRSRSMGMQKSEELKDVVKVIFDQLAHLSINAEHAGIVVDYEPKKDWHFWIAETQDIPAKVTVPYLDLVWDRQFTEAKKKGKDFFTTLMDFEEKNSFYKVLLPHVEGLTKKVKDFYFSCPGLAISTAIEKDIGLYIENFSGTPYSSEENEILRRFAKVFQQTYTRFLDLKKAEAQAREAQIETALERVRARSMAMHKTGEISEVVTVLFDQLNHLNVPFLQIWITILNLDKDYFDIWFSPLEGVYETTQYFTMPSMYFEDTAIKTWRSKAPFSYRSLKSVAEVDEFINACDAITGSTYFSHGRKIKNYNQLEFIEARHEYGFISKSNTEPPTETEANILQRFAKVFEQAYTRFLDIEKAEAQARESQIEAALEKVRSQSLAMHSTGEMQLVANAVFEQLQALGLEMDVVGMSGVIGDKQDYDVWIGGAPLGSALRIPYNEDTQVQRDYNKMLKDRPELFARTYSGQVKKEYIDRLLTHGDFPKALKKKMETSEAFTTLIAPKKNSGIQVVRYTDQPYTDQDAEILKRFAGVFEQAYIRFMDLEKAEAQAREAQIEASLERIRARAMAMKSSEELHDVLCVLFQQFDVLGIKPISAFLSLFSSEERVLTYRATGTSGARTQGSQTVAIDSLEVWKEIYDKWKTDTSDAVEVIHYPKEILPKLFELFEETFASMPADERMTADHFPEGGYTMHGHTRFGYIGYNHTRLPTEEEKEILTKFATEFERVYQRFLDIEKAEAQARQAQIEAALERVRTRTMAMHNTEDIAATVTTFFNEIMGLGLGNTTRSGIGILSQSEKMELWTASVKDTSDVVLQSGLLDMTIHPLLQGVKKAWQAGDPHFTYELSGEDKLVYFKAINKAPEYPMKIDLKKLPETVYHYSFPFRDGSLFVFSDEPLWDDILDIFKRFAAVFGQTYTRYLDLHKAEAQAREAQIEAALERIRARAMAMHTSRELNEVLSVLFEQFNILGINPVWAHLSLINLEDNTFTYRMSRADKNNKLSGQVVDLNARPEWQDSVEAFKASKPNSVSCLEFPKEVLPKIWELFDESFSSIKDEYQINMEDFPNGLFNTQGYCKFGYIGFNHNRKATEEEILIVARFATEFGRIYQRYLDIEKAEAQAREAQIETALERVRSRSMAMHKSEELADLSLELVKQVQALGVDTWFCAFNIYDDESKGSLEWGSNGQGTFPKYRTPMEGIFLRYYKAGKKGETLLINEIGEDECPAHYDYLCTLPGVGEQLLKMKDEGIPFPTSQIDHVAFFKYGYVLFITYEPSPESHEIFKRFAKVFEQTYTRFLDLQKAEAQAKEAQIEAALEKVRSQSLAMHTTSEMQLVANAVYDQLRELGVVMDAVGMSGVIEEKKDYDVWIGGAPMGKALRIPYNKDTKVQRDYNKAIKERPDLFARTYSGKVKEEYVNHLLTHGDFPRDLKRKMVTSSAFSTSISFAKNSSIQIARYTNNQYTAEENEILKRFAKVFEQAYIRFMDLQKAEAQAKEAQIEAALEKVRSASLAMHQSKDLHNVLVMLYNQLDALGLKMHSAQISESIEDPKAIHSWIVTNGAVYPEQVHIPFSKNIYFKRIREAVTNGESFYTLKLSKQQKDKHFHHIFDNSSLKNVPQERKDLIFSSPGLGTSNAMGKYTSLSIMRYDGILYSEEENEIIKRFAKVFEQSYTRFLDIQKAESQAKEAQIEAALEKVRSRSMAMHNSSEMLDVIEVVSGQLRHLNLDFDTVSFATNDQKGTFNFWMTSRGQPKPIFMEIPHLNNPVINRVYEAKKNNETFISDVFSAAENKEWTKHLIKNSDLKNFPEPIKKFILNAPGFARSSFFLENIDLYLVNYRAVPFAEEDNLIFQRFAKVFEQAYTRFLDLQKAEARIREAQIEAALEKVRSRTMAMHKSQELHKVVLTVSQEIRNLGLNISAAHIYRFEEGDKGINMWIAGDGGLYPNEVYFPYFKHQFFDGIYHARTTNKTFFTMSGTSKKEKNRLYRHLLNNSKIEISEDRKKYVLDAKSWAGIVALGKYSGIGVLRLIEEVEEEFSVEEYEILKRLSKVFEQAYIRFLDLQKAEAQAREAQIEAALEKVRSASLAMHQSKDLHNVLVMLYNQLASLGLKMHSAQIIESIDDFKELHAWIVTNGVVYPEQVHAPFTKNIFFKRFREAVTNGESFFTLKFSKRQKDNLFQHFFDNTIIRNAPQARKDLVLSSPGLGISNAIGEYTSLSIMRYDGNLYSDEENEIIKRFLKVFEQSYRRFLDLQKAESQAREAQIEAALERVRSKAMAMHSSDDLADTVEILYKELDTLQVHALRFGHAKVISDTKIVELHTATDLGKVVGQVKLEGHPLLEKIYEHFLAKEDLYYALQGEEMKSYYSILGRAIDVPIPTMDTVQHGYFFFLGDTANYAWSDKALDEEELKVYRRLITVLNLTYKRYEELKNAESQAREAQIEGALERVRSKTMAMHNSEDLEDIVVSLFDEVMNLGLDKSIRCGIGILEGHEGMETRSVNKSSDGTVDLKVGMLNMTIHPMLVGLKKAWKNGRKSYSYEYNSKDVRKYYTALNKEPEYPFSADLTSLPNQEYHRSFFYSSGIIFAFSENPISEESSKILARFAAVFGQTYQRFLDLQKAEERAKDAIKQASLDRVRGQIASMRSTEDLEQITPLVWNELKALDIPFIRCGVFIIDESSKTVQAFLSAPDGHSLGVMKIPFDAEKVTAATVANWKKKEVYKTHWDKDQFLEFMQLMKDLGQVSNEKEYQGAEQPPESLHLHFVPFTQGMLYVGNVGPLEDEQIELIQTLADAFAIAYARYEDFVKLEKAKEQVENTLEELKATQNQLVQSEKMASLGELTAGIAHEIQNPLNFVNNFSEVSVELLEEMLEEMSKGDLEEAKALMEDIKQNLDKINHHGKRADGIVKGMLQHSRTSSGEKELTDLNVLADEYLRLAYHGLRAKDKTFNATLETHFDESIGKVNILAQDMGRVILNLITNAFYVVQKKKEEQPEGYAPTVTVSTKKKKNSVEISVKDNGNGIPKEIKEKIFQPFFTTKPTGQGTGLGLSMSYDIVTKGHGGSLKVETEEGKGTTFCINLPVIK